MGILKRFLVLYVAVSKIIHESLMNIYSDKVAHIQVLIKCRYSVAQICTYEDMLAQYLGMPYLDDVMSHNELTTLAYGAFRVGF